MNDKLDKIHHIALNVANLESAIEWYQTSFSCQIEYQDQRQAVLAFDNIKLKLVLPSQERTHVAFIKDNAKEFGELNERPDGTQSTYISDSSGNQVELVKV